MKMGELTAGDLVWELESISNTLRLGIVGSVQVRKGKGLYNPHTLSGTVIVDNVLALTFTEVLPRSMNLQSFLTAPFCSFVLALSISQAGATAKWHATTGIGQVKWCLPEIT